MTEQKMIKTEQQDISAVERMKMKAMSSMVSDVISSGMSAEDGVVGLMNITGNYYDAKVYSIEEINGIRPNRPDITKRAWSSLGRKIRLAQAKFESMTNAE